MASVRSPLSGCTILLAAVVVLVFLVGFSIWVPFRQADEIEKFTRTEPEPVALAEPAAEEVADLESRLASFHVGLNNAHTKSRLALARRDLNVAIASFEPLEALRGTFHVREIRDQALVIDICYQINGRPRLARKDEDGLISSDPRYLVGTIYGTPVLTNREILLRVERLEVTNAEVAEGFMGHFSTLRLFEGSRTDPVLGPAMATLTTVSLENDALVFSRDPGDQPPGTVSDEDFSSGGRRIVLLLGLAAVAFLIVAGTVATIRHRRQLRTLEKHEKANRPDPGA